MYTDNADFHKQNLNKVVTYLIEIGSNGSLDNPMRFVQDNVEWTFQNNTYTPFPFKIEGIQSSSKGEQPRIQLSISNVTNLIVDVLNQDLEGVLVRIYVLREGETSADIWWEFSIASVGYNAEWLTLSLGEKVNFAKNFPSTKYTESCPFKFKGWQCKYSGSATKCNHTVETCRTLGNVARFGGFKGGTD